MASYSITQIQGIAATNAKKLAKAEIRTTADFLAKCATRKGRKQVAEQTGVEEKRLLTWANLADLMRITGIGPQYSELLEAAGVDTVKELRKRKPENLATTMAEVWGKQKKKLTKTVPGQKRIEGWIAQAKEMKPAISH